MHLSITIEQIYCNGHIIGHTWSYHWSYLPFLCSCLISKKYQQLVTWHWSYLLGGPWRASWPMSWCFWSDYCVATGKWGIWGLRQGAVEFAVTIWCCWCGNWYANCWYGYCNCDFCVCGDDLVTTVGATTATRARRGRWGLRQGAVLENPALSIKPTTVAHLLHCYIHNSFHMKTWDYIKLQTS